MKTVRSVLVREGHTDMDVRLTYRDRASDVVEV